MADWHQLESLLVALNDPNDDVRKNAEAMLAEYKKHCDVLITQFIQILRNSQVQQARETAAVVFRRVCFIAIDEPVLWPQASQNVRLQGRAELLICMKDEQLNRVRKKICDCVCEIAKEADDEPWPELLPTLHELTQSPNALHRESAYQIFANHPTVFGDQLERYIGVLHQLLLNAIAGTEPHIEVRVGAMKAGIAFIRCEAMTKSKTAFSDLVPPMLSLVVACTQMANGEEDATQALQSFVELAEMEPLFLRPHVVLVVQTMVQICGNTQLDDEPRRLAIEVVCELCEKRPQMMRKVPELAQTVLPVVFGLMIEVEDDDDWSTTDDLDDEIEESNAIVAEQVMDRLACALGGKTLLPVAFQHIMSMLQDPNWKCRHAALMAISAIGEGTQRTMEDELGNILQYIVPYVRDPHERVRYAACNALGQMSTDFAPELQQTYHELVVPALINTMEDSNPRVQTHAAAALVNFAESADPVLLNPYLDSLLSKLYLLLGSPRRITQEQAMQTIAVVAEAAKDLFVKYYDTFMPMMIHILEQAVDSQHRMLRGKTMECLSLICYVVGPEKSRADALRTMEILVRTPTEDMESDDPQATFIDWACLRICNTIGAEFMPYLLFVMPPLLVKARLKPDLAILDTDDPAAEAQYDAADGWEFVNLHSQKIGIRTTTLEEKSAAIELLGMYAAKLKGAFGPYVVEVAEIMTQSLGFLFHDGVRTAAASSLAPLLACAIEAQLDGEVMSTMWNAMVEEVARMLLEESTQDCLVDFIVGFERAVQVVGEKCLTAEQMKGLSRAFLIQLQHINQRALERIERRGDLDWDDELEEEIENEDVTDEMILKELSELMHTLFKLHGTDLLPLWDGICGSFAQLLHPERPEGDRQWALCVFDDFIEYCGPAAWPYHSAFLPEMMTALHDPLPTVRHAAVYGIGVAAWKGRPDFAQACADAVPVVTAMITSPDARSEGHIDCTENAISAMAKILAHIPEHVPAEALIPQWLSWLPITNNPDEGVHVYGYLCTLIENNHPAIAQNLPHVVRVLAYAVNTDNVKEENVNERVIAILRQLATHHAAVFADISPELQQKIQQALGA